MSKEEYRKIMAEIEALPQGGITYKKINGKKYVYYQWRKDGKQRSRRTTDEELEILTKSKPTNRIYILLCSLNWRGIETC